MSEPSHVWNSIACKTAFESNYSTEEPVPEFNENDMISVLETRYRVHKEYTLLVDVTQLSPWRYIRRPHKAVVKKLVAIMKV